MKKSTGVILVIIIILLLGVIGVGGYMYFKNNNVSSSEVSELKNEVANLKQSVTNTENTTNTTENTTNETSKNATTESKSTSNAVSYSSLKGTYVSQNINMNEGTDLNATYMNYRILLNEDGSFIAYYLTGDTDCHYVGYYTVLNNELTLHSVVLTGNDPSAELSNEVIKFTLDNDGKIKDDKGNVFTKKSSTLDEDTNIANTINSYMDGCETSGKDGQGPWFSGLDQ